jgi:hypothetical protein
VDFPSPPITLKYPGRAIYIASAWSYPDSARGRSSLEGAAWRGDKMGVVFGNASFCGSLIVSLHTCHFQTPLSNCVIERSDEATSGDFQKIWDGRDIELLITNGRYWTI